MSTLVHFILALVDTDLLNILKENGAQNFVTFMSKYFLCDLVLLFKDIWPPANNNKKTSFLCSLVYFCLSQPASNGG